AQDAAVLSGCDLLFATGINEDERQLYRDIGFMDSGSIVNYAEISEKDYQADESLTQSVLVI
ncbi:MAG: hypothetical protein Q9P44_02670, partial [Anaerolineae bacterium]|nr:hypothetical protein [Anaerolineae bacterium]